MRKSNTFKKFLALAVSAFMLAILPNANVLTVSAEGPTTYYVKYMGEEGWHYQTGSSWDDEASHYGIDLMQESVKNGDIVIVGDASLEEQLVFHVHLSNLTIANRADTFAMVNVTGGIDNCHFLEGSAGSVTGDVFNGYVYNVATANFCSNVTNLYAYNNVYGEGPNIGVTGTVGYYMPEFEYNTNAPYGINFEADTFSVVNGDLETESHHYTRDASGGPIASSTQPATSQPAASQSSASNSSASNSSANEYDAVPKTGETSPVIWLSLAAVCCSGISLFLRKSGNK